MGDDTGPCPCHETMDDAIRGHQHLVREQAIRLSSPSHSDWDDLISDGTMALWQALDQFGPDRRDILGYLRLRIRHRMIDGMRSRSLWRTHRPVLLPLEESDLPEVDAHHGATIEFTDQVRALAALDPRLPGLAALLSCGYSRGELGDMTGVSRQWVSQLMLLAQRHLDAA